MIELLLHARAHDLGGMTVGRVLPAPKRRSLGPFVFLDHMGPTRTEPGKGFDVRPHPHVGLSTLTYLYAGDLVHRDSLGVVQTVRPGEVNLMSAGRGIVHSERPSDAFRAAGGPMHGLQFWLAQPAELEDSDPRFQHAGTDDLPTFGHEGVRGVVVVGELEGARSPIELPTRTFFYDVQMDEGATLTLRSEGDERGVYVVSGAITIEGEPVEATQLALLDHALAPTIRATGPTHLAILGGAPLDGPRLMYWNFVATSQARIDDAKARWRNREFPPIPGDDDEFIPLPE